MENKIGKKEELVTNVQQATWHYFFSHPGYYITALVIVVISFVVCFYISAFYPFGFALVFLLILYSFVSAKIRGYLMEQFAKSLGYEYLSKGDPSSSVDGSLFSMGHDNNISDMIKGKDGDRVVRIFLYRCTIGYGKSAHTYFYTVFENTFNGNMPHILLHKEQFFFGGNPVDFSGGKHVTLEGDFNKYFSLYVEKDFEIEAYQIFDPDFMQELIETSKSFGFEFYQNKLYIYMPRLINKRSELDAMFTLSQKLCTHLEPVVNSIKDDIEATKNLLIKK